MISATAQHALRATRELGRLRPGESLLGREVAKLADVSPSYLSKILRALARRGLVEATRGVRGGYRLAKPAAEISLREVVEALEPDAFDPVCLLKHDRRCSNEHACPVHDRYRNVRDAFATFLASSTVNDLIAEPVESDS